MNSAAIAKNQCLIELPGVKTLRLDCIFCDELSLKERREIAVLLNSSYNEWGIEDVFEKYPTPHQLYVYRLFSDNTLVASRQILLVAQPNMAPFWAQELAASLNLHKFAISSRAIVHPDFQNKGLGTALIKHINRDIYQSHNITTILGSSTRLGAIALYQRLGVKIWREDIEALPFKNPTPEKYPLFCQMLSNHSLRRIRFHNPIRYVYHQHVFPAHWNNYLWHTTKRNPL
jgi:GNAT superfamily N-acetyltransferase